MCAKRRARDALHAVGSRRFDRQLAASCFEPLDHGLDFAVGFASDVVA
jgi:hypothetical protein